MSQAPELGDLVVGRYKIKALLNEGPGYLVYLAFDSELDLEICLLWFRKGVFPTAKARSRFVRGDVADHQLIHPRLRRVYARHQLDDRVFAAAERATVVARFMQLGAGTPAEEDEIVRYASAIGEGLDAAHALGHVHGFLVPSDIVSVADDVRVSAVGLYRAAARDVAKTFFAAQRRYIAPEVVAGSRPTVRSDVYSMATLLLEVAAGILAKSTEDALAAAGAAHPRLESVLRRALSAKPKSRPSSPLALLRQVRGDLSMVSDFTTGYIDPSGESEDRLRSCSLQFSGAAGEHFGGDGPGHKAGVESVDSGAPRGEPSSEQQQ